MTIHLQLNQTNSMTDACLQIHAAINSFSRYTKSYDLIFEIVEWMYVVDSHSAWNEYCVFERTQSTKPLH